VIASRNNRETPWVAIPGIFGWGRGEAAITIFKKEKYRRRVSKRKCSLSEENRKKKLE
jgi:hypothetical protein